MFVPHNLKTKNQNHDTIIGTMNSWQYAAKVIRDHINYAISRYRSPICQPCDILVPRGWTISCTNACL